MESGNKRLAPRQPVLRAAKVHFNNSLVDCLVLDISSSGVRLSTEAFIPFPEAVTVELRSGGTWTAVKRWQAGLEVGFELTGFAGLHRDAVAEASRIYDQVLKAGIKGALAELGDKRYFDHSELKSASEAVVAALERLEQTLRAATGRT